jgi:hypothetical protein
MTINVLASEQSNATEVTAYKVIKLLNYCNTHPETKIQYHASEKILHIHSDASCLSENEAKSRAGGFFYMGIMSFICASVVNHDITKVMGQ